MSPSCEKTLNELMAEQNVRQRTKQLPPMGARSHRPSSLKPGSTNSSARQEEILGDGTDIHNGSSEEINQEL